MADFSANYDPSLQGTPQFGDLLMINGDFVLTSDVDSRGTDPVLQFIIQRIRTFLGECFVDSSKGLPWHNQFLGQKGSYTGFEAALKNCVLSTPGVLQLVAWSSALNTATRVLSFTFSAVTNGGQVSYSSDVPIGFSEVTS